MPGSSDRPVAGGGALPAVRIVYRSHGGENAKDRPPFYSKLLGLVSVVRAVRQARQDGVVVDVTWWNDGPIPADRLAVMRENGEVLQIDGGSNRASYRAALDAAAGFPGAPRDVVWFAEDDYLYLPGSFGSIARAAASIPDADYLSVYGGYALDERSPRSATRWHERMGAADATSTVVVDGTTWFRGMSTTSTFGVRLGVLREDRRLLSLLPYTGGAWDHASCLTVQGRRPFEWSELGREFLPFGEPVGQWPARVVRSVVRVGANVASRRPEERRRHLYLADPVGAMHMELPMVSGPGTDWEAEARAVHDWASGEGIPLPSFGGGPAGPGVTER
jgi:hypothetical protein